jgi:hypothetical protein
MAPAQDRPPALELLLGAGVTLAALGAAPLGLEHVADAPALTAGVMLESEAEAPVPPLVVLLLRLFGLLPVGDLATRANLAAAVMAGFSAVLLARLGQRLLRGLEPLRDLTERPGESEVPVFPRFEPPTMPTVVPQVGLVEEPTTPTGVPPWVAEAEGLAPAATSGGPIVPVSPGLRGPAPVPARRAIERDISLREPRLPSQRQSTGARMNAGPAAREISRTVDRVSGRAGISQPITPTASRPTTRRINQRRSPLGGERTGGFAPAPANLNAGPEAWRGFTAPDATPPAPRALETHETIALVGAVLCPLASLGLFLALSSSPSAALTLVLVLGAWNRLLPLERSPGTPRRGLLLAFIAGLSLGADPVAPLVILPPVVWSAWRWLRDGERWPWLAPLALAGGATVAFLPLGGPSLVSVVRTLLETLGRGLASGALIAVARGWLDAIGVLAGLIAAVGAAVLLVRRPRLFIFTLASVDVTLALVAGQGGATNGRFVAGSSAWMVLVALSFAPLLLGLGHLAGKLGRARGGAALALAVIALVWPALDGGARRWQRDGAVPQTLLESAEARLSPAAGVVPGSPEMAALLRYGQALGRRPDLVLLPAPPIAAAASEP